MIPNKNKDKNTEKVLNSRGYRKAKAKAEEYVNNPKSMYKIADEAAIRIKNEGPLSKIFNTVNASIRLIKAYANCSYQKIPWQSMVLIIASIIYFVMPIDFIPDFIIGLGFIDDAAILSWTLHAMKKEIDSFIEWENGRTEERKKI